MDYLTDSFLQGNDGVTRLLHKKVKAYYPKSNSGMITTNIPRIQILNYHIPFYVI